MQHRCQHKWMFLWRLVSHEHWSQSFFVSYKLRLRSFNITSSFLPSSSLKRALNWHCPTSLQTSLSQPLFEQNRPQSICLFSPAPLSSHKSHLSVTTQLFIETMFTSKSHTMHVIAIQIRAIENQPTLWFLYDANRAEGRFLWLYMLKEIASGRICIGIYESKWQLCLESVYTPLSHSSVICFFIHYFIDICWADLVRETFNFVCEGKRRMTDKLSFTISEQAVPVKSKPLLSCFWIHLKYYIYFQ